MLQAVPIYSIENRLELLPGLNLTSCLLLVYSRHVLINALWKTAKTHRAICSPARWK